MLSRRPGHRSLFWVLWLLAALLAALPARAQDAAPVKLALFKGPVTPVLANYVDRAITQAEDEGAAAVVIELDTPGGSVDITKQTHPADDGRPRAGHRVRCAARRTCGFGRHLHHPGGSPGGDGARQQHRGGQPGRQRRGRPGRDAQGQRDEHPGRPTSRTWRPGGANARSNGLRRPCARRRPRPQTRRSISASST